MDDDGWASKRATTAEAQVQGQCAFALNYVFTKFCLPKHIYS